MSLKLDIPRLFCNTGVWKGLESLGMCAKNIGDTE